jgi:hypothetical protein
MNYCESCQKPTGADDPNGLCADCRDADEQRDELIDEVGRLRADLEQKTRTLKAADVAIAQLQQLVREVATNKRSTPVQEYAASMAFTLAVEQFRATLHGEPTFQQAWDIRQWAEKAAVMALDLSAEAGRVLNLLQQEESR